MSRQTLYVPALVVALLAARPALAQDITEQEEQAIKAAVAKVAPSVVQIETSGGTEIITAGPRGQQVRKGVGPTTGLIISSDGYVISSAFNFANKPTAIFVTVPGHKERYVAKVVANDQTRMLTLLKIDANGLTVPQAAPKKDIKIGQWSLALGRTLERPEDRELKGSPSVSIGIVSALNRIWGKALQTDAKVSPVNYGGPLVAITGQVLGVLVPASPQGEGETAGLEWYDSGIGFAVYMEDINAAFPRLKEGRDLRRGLLGITMQGNDQYGATPTIATVAPDSAASRHGIKPGDVITEIDGQPVHNHAQVLHKLGGKYDGDTVNVTIKRGNETIKIENIKLSGALTSYPHAWLGILPLRDDPEPGQEIRYVYPASPADAAKLKEGDRIMKIGSGPAPPQAFTGRDQLTAKLNPLPPGTEVKLEVLRKADKKTETVTVKLGVLPDTVPEKLPDLATLKRALEPLKGAQPKGEPKPEEKKDAKDPETGFLKRTNAARDHDYWLYVPANRDKKFEQNVAHALVIWLHPVGKNKEKDFEEFVDVWRDICDDHHIILLMPKSENENGWLPAEADAVVGMVGEVSGQYTIDRQRVIAHGMGLGGQMAFYMGFRDRGLIRGVATTGAVLASALKDNVANQRLQFFMVAGGKDPLAKDIQESKTKLASNKFSVVYREIPEMGHQYLDAKTLLELTRWIDSLDRQ
jgi:S1-C subfamily serine protease/predicted esterase